RPRGWATAGRIRCSRRTPRWGPDMPPGTKVFDLDWVLGHLGQIGDRLVQHLPLTVLPRAFAILISLVLAVWAVRQPRAYGPVTAIAGLLYTIPSLAAFAAL